MTAKQLFDTRSLLFTTFISIAYLLLSASLVGFKTDQVWLLVLFNACYYLSWSTRRVVTGFSVFIVYWIIFDYMKALPNYLFNAVHIKDLYEAEKSFFGITIDGVKVTPNEYWLMHTHTWMDLMSGVFYLCWVPVPMLFAGYLFYRDKKIFLHFSLTFLFLNLLGFVFYYIYPAAPPWYVQLNGFQFFAKTPGNTGGLSRFDSLVGINIFHSIYAKSSNVFAAMPSLHSAYPVLVLYYARKHANMVFQVLAAIVVLGIWFSAVYNSHHYVLDVLGGIICASVSIALYHYVLMRSAAYNRFITRFCAAILPPHSHTIP